MSARVTPETLIDEMVEQLKVSAESDCDDGLADACRRYLTGDVHRSWAAVHAIEDRICQAINAGRSKVGAK